MRRIRKYVVLCSLFFVLAWGVLRGNAAEAADKEEAMPKDSELYSYGAVLMDAKSGRVLFGKNSDEQLPMASTTKIMTCIVALELGNLEDVVTASAYASSQPKVKLYLNKGEQVLLEDLLYSLMLESHNDTAAAIAEHIGAMLLDMENDREAVKNRSIETSKKAVAAFIKAMNEKAAQLQCYNTWFITPNGLDATETFLGEEGQNLSRIHSTTARELARIMSYCILWSPQKEKFLEITGTYRYDFNNVENSRSFCCSNHNAFLNMMEGALSGKTGYTGQAGYCYVGALERDGRYFVVSLLNSGAYGNKTRKWKDVCRLMGYGIQCFAEKEVFDGQVKSREILVYNAKPEPGKYFEAVSVRTCVQGQKPVSVLLADWEKAEVIIRQKEQLIAPVHRGQLVGQVEVWGAGKCLEKFDIVCSAEIEEKDYMDKLSYIFFIYFCSK